MSPPKKRNPAAPASANGAAQNLLATVTITSGGLMYKELAGSIGVHPKTVSRWAREGKLVIAFTPGGRPRVMGAKQ